MSGMTVTRSLALNRKQSGAIIGVKGQRLGDIIRIQPEVEIILGRNEAQSDILFDDPKISRKHCGIVYHSQTGNYSVCDYSRNGLYRENGERLKRGWNERILPGTAICLGNDRNIIRLG